MNGSVGIMSLNKTKLEEFVESFGDYEFASKYYNKQIIFFGYYLQKYEEYDQFTPTDIQSCFEQLDLGMPENISDLMKKAADSGKLIRKGNGYRIPRIETKNIEGELKQTLKKNGDERVYHPGQVYELYRDIKTIIESAKNEVLIIDTYANEEVIDLYLGKLPLGIKIMILTNKPQGNFVAVATKFKQKHHENFVVKTNDKCHDRVFFVDKKCYVIGQSIDKAAIEKPTYLIEIQNAGTFRQVFQSLFDSGKRMC